MIDSSCSSNVMHLKHFATIKPDDYLAYKQDSSGFFYLEDSKKHDAVFSVEGFAEFVRLCPSLDRFRYDH